MHSDDALQVTVIPVGHGDGTLIRWMPKEAAPFSILVDGGPKAGGREVVRYLRAEGISTLDCLVLSHVDADHVDGLEEVVSAVEVKQYLGPCLPAFERHRWLFADRIQRGLDQTCLVEEKLESRKTAIHYPVEGYRIALPGGAFQVRVLWPAAQLLERLLLGDDTASLFAHYPMPQRWLFEGARTVDVEENSTAASVRSKIRSSSYLEPGDISRWPSVPERQSREQLAAEFGKVFDLSPEFFGNSVVNDTSLVLFVEARIGDGVTRRLLLPGDLENWAYLAQRYDRALGCDLLKASHHGGRIFIENREHEALDDIFQLVQPRAVTVSASGRHHLPRNSFRNAAIRWGATLLCSCRRNREFVFESKHSEKSCFAGYGCEYVDKPFTITFSSSGIAADTAACSSAPRQGPVPLITIRQHVMEPSNLMDELTEGELNKHSAWIGDELRRIHRERLAQGRSTGADEAVSAKLLAQLARADGRSRLAVDLETVLARCRRDTLCWTDRSYRQIESAYTLPTKDERKAISSHLQNFVAIVFRVDKGCRNFYETSSDDDIIARFDLTLLAAEICGEFRFPTAMFEDSIWPNFRPTKQKGWHGFFPEDSYDGGYFVVSRSPNLPALQAAFSGTVPMDFWRAFSEKSKGPLREWIFCPGATSSISWHPLRHFIDRWDRESEAVPTLRLTARW